MAFDDYLTPPTFTIPTEPPRAQHLRPSPYLTASSPSPAGSRTMNVLSLLSIIATFGVFVVGSPIENTLPAEQDYETGIKLQYTTYEKQSDRGAYDMSWLGDEEKEGWIDRVEDKVLGKLPLGQEARKDSGKGYSIGFETSWISPEIFTKESSMEVRYAIHEFASEVLSNPGLHAVAHVWYPPACKSTNPTDCPRITITGSYEEAK